jgi:hypothetical protein
MAQAGAGIVKTVRKTRVFMQRHAKFRIFHGRKVHIRKFVFKQKTYIDIKRL